MKRFITPLVMSVMLAPSLIVGNTLAAPSSQAQVACASTQATVTSSKNRSGEVTECQGLGLRRYTLIKVCAGSKVTARVVAVAYKTVTKVAPGACSDKFGGINADVTVTPTVTVG